MKTGLVQIGFGVIKKRRAVNITAGGVNLCWHFWCCTNNAQTLAALRNRARQPVEQDFETAQALIQEVFRFRSSIRRESASPASSIWRARNFGCTHHFGALHHALGLHARCFNNLVGFALRLWPQIRRALSASNAPGEFLLACSACASCNNATNMVAVNSRRAGLTERWVPLAMV